MLETQPLPHPAADVPSGPPPVPQDALDGAARPEASQAAAEPTSNADLRGAPEGDGMAAAALAAALPNRADASDARERSGGGVSGAEEEARGPTAPASDQPSIIVDMGPDFDGLIRELIECAPDEEGQAVEALLSLGTMALPALVERFPGPLWFERRGAPRQLPQGRDVSAIARALMAFGERAAPYIVELMESADADVRFYASLLACDSPRPSLLMAFVQRAFDPDPQVRLLVRGALRRFSPLSDYGDALALLRTRAGDASLGVAERLNALEALASTRDAGSVQLLVELSEDGDRQLSVPARRALVATTGQEFDSARKWRTWLQRHGDKSRTEWLIESLMHAEEQVRGVAGEELQRLTQVYHGFVASAPKRERERVQRRYRQWLRHEARHR